MTALDRDVSTRQKEDAPENMKSFVDRIWILDDELRERRRAVDSWMETHANQRRRILDEQLRVGKMAWLSIDGITLPWDKHRRTKKFRQKWYGPFEILEQTSPVSFKLHLPATSNIHPIFHANLIKPASDVNMHGKRREPLPAVSQEDNTYEVDTILASRETKDGKLEYLVHWKGYLFEEATWEPQRNLQGSADLLRKYHAKHGDNEPTSIITEPDSNTSIDSDESDTDERPAKKRRQKK